MVSALDEGQQVGVDRVRLCGGHAVREALVGLQRAILEQLCRQRPGVRIGNDLIVVAMHYQDGHRDLFQVFGEVGLRERDDAVVVRLGAAHHALPPPVLDHGLGGFGAGTVEAIERARRDVAIELRAAGRNLRLEFVKHLLGRAAGIGCGLHHQRRHRADDGGLRHPALAVPRQIVHDFAAAGGMADMNGVLEIEKRGQGREVVGVVIHVVPVGRLTGPAVAAAVVGDNAIAMIEEEHHLRIPVIGRQRPAMTEHDGLTRSPILVVDLGAVLGLEGGHVSSFAVIRCRWWPVYSGTSAQ